MLFNPYSTEDLTEAISYLLDNPGVCQQLVNEGRVRCQQFNWSEAAERTSGAYRAALAASRIRVGNRLSMVHIEDCNDSSRASVPFPITMRKALDSFALPSS